MNKKTTDNRYGKWGGRIICLRAQRVLLYLNLSVHPPLIPDILFNMFKHSPLLGSKLHRKKLGSERVALGK